MIDLYRGGSLLTSSAILIAYATIVSSAISKSRTLPAVLTDPKYGEHKYAIVNGVRLHYVEAGDRSKPLMVFLHGFPDFWWSWRHQIPEFSKDYWTVAMDARGFNLSERPIGIEKYALQLLIGDLKGLVEHLNRKKFVLVCHDWGAIVGSQFVAQNRHMVHKYVILGAPPLKVMKQLLATNLDQIRKSSYVFLYQAPLLPEQMLAANDYATLSSLYGKDAEVYKYVFQQPGALTAGINYYRANLSPLQQRCGTTSDSTDITSDSTNGAGGMLVLGEKDDYMSQDALNATKNAYPQMRVEMIPGVNHYVQQVASKVVNSLIREFLGPASDCPASDCRVQTI